jgi:penicillin-binding protein 2
LKRSDWGRIRDVRDVRSRLAKVLIVAIVSFLALIALHLQVFQTSKYRLHSDRNRLRKIEIPPPRGLITDRQGEILAENIPSSALYLVPYYVESADQTLARLDDLLALNDRQMKEIKYRIDQGGFTPVLVADNVGIADRSFLEEHRDLIPGLLIRSEPLRYYRHGRELSHVIGYVGESSSLGEEEESGRKASNTGFVGKAGIELYYDKLLRGRPGAYFVEVDARGREVRAFQGREPVRPQRGADIRLTIDLDLQLEAYRLFPEGRKGALLCMDPRNGEILAMVSRPDYDPNAMVTGVSFMEWKVMVNDPGSPFFNRVTQAGYPPGSAFKPVVALMGLQKGIIDLHFKEPIPCRGGIQFGTRWFRCWKEGGHGRLDLYQAIVQSCDSYFYQLGNRIGLEELLANSRRYGFNELTGVDLPDESKGFIPDREWYDRQYGKRGWGRGVALNLSIGQGELLVTPLQLAVFYSMIANGGSFVRPHLLKSGGEVAGPSALRLPFSVVQPLQVALAGVVSEEKGTGRYAGEIAGVKMAGKTGTAQNPHGEDHSIFVGYGPVDNPRILMVAVIEEAGHGSSVAAPLVGRLLKKYLGGSRPDQGPGRVVAAEEG